MIIDTIVNLATSIFDRVVPNKTQEQQQQFTLELTKLLAQSDQLKGQLEINQAEAANPNRKYPTWRELCGYVVVIALTYQWIVVPLITMIAALVSHPVNPKDLFIVDILDVLYLLGGMLGLDVGPIVANRLRAKK